MALWTANNDAAGKPKWANTAAVYGVDRTEARLYGKGVSPGWVNVTSMSGGVVSVAVANAGTGYANGDAVLFANGVTNGSGVVVTADSANLTGGLILNDTVNVTANGIDFTTVLSNSDALFYYSNSSNKVYRTLNKVVNSSFANVTLATNTGANTDADYGRAAQVSSVGVVDGGQFTSQTGNTAITTVGGVGAGLTLSYGGRIGRTQVENLVAVSNMTNDASDDTVFPDS
jgi:hypothetical protein